MLCKMGDKSTMKSSGGSKQGIADAGAIVDASV